MKFTTPLVVLFAAIALATPLQDASSPAAPEPEMFKLEKRRSCSGNRLPYEVCQGNLIAKMNSRHNWYVLVLCIYTLATLGEYQQQKAVVPYCVKGREEKRGKSR